MDKNFLLAIIVSMLIILLFMSPQYQQRFGKPLPPEPEQESTESPAPVLSGDEQPPSRDRITKPDKQTAVQAKERGEEPSENIQINPPEAETDFILENENIKITCSTRGGDIKKTVTKNFIGRSADELAQLVTEGENWYQGSIIEDESVINLYDIIFRIKTQTDTHVVLEAELTGERTVTRELLPSRI